MILGDGSFDETHMDTEANTIIDHSIDADETATCRLSEISNLDGVTRVVGLTDLHQANQETPTSIVTASRGTVYPELSSNVINCGMSLVKTGLTEDDVTPEFVSTFCGEVNDRKADYRPDRDDAIQLLLRGAEYVPERWDCARSVLDHIENGGSMFDDETRPEDVTDIVPPWLLRYGSTYENTPVPSLGSNHFVEFQVIDEIADAETGEEWGLSEGQVVIFLHGDFTLTSMINWHYSNRLKFRKRIPLADRVKLQLSKAAFHLLRDGSGNFAANWRHYNSKSRYTGFDVEMSEGEQLTNAIYAAMNFGYANRLLTALCLRDAIAALAPDAEPAELLWDVGHDTIQAETYEGTEHWIHRKGAAKAVSGKPALVSGSYNMNSFLGKSAPGADAFVSSYDHGCSNVIEHFQSEGELPELDHTTPRFSLSDGAQTGEVRHVDPEPIKTLVRNLVEHNIVSKVAWLRPIANVGK
jgi:tRNA-splicing ligase RtcB